MRGIDCWAQTATLAAKSSSEIIKTASSEYWSFDFMLCPLGAGSDEFNQKLSEQRAESVRQYLIEQGLPDSSLTATGFGKSMPIADNSTAAGRQQNRRVEIIISGEVIGTKIGK